MKKVQIEQAMEAYKNFYNNAISTSDELMALARKTISKGTFFNEHYSVRNAIVKKCRERTCELHRKIYELATHENPEMVSALENALKEAAEKGVPTWEFRYAYLSQSN